MGEEKDHRVDEALLRIQRSATRLNKLVSNTIHDQWLSAILTDQKISNDRFTLLSRLKKKMETTSTPLPVRAIRNMGYVFYEPVQLVP